LAIRAEGYGFPGVTVDGNDVIAVYDATVAARKRALAGEGPTLIEAKTYRYRGHYEGDPMVYRPKGELEEWRKRDPIPAFRLRLIQSGIINEGEIEELMGSVQEQLDEAVTYAASAPFPVAEEALQGVYADTHNGLVF
jgi:pyruvate dehydrogenase E1 component alpha subunit